MVRSIAREISVHFSYELGFTGMSVDELLDSRLSQESFDSLKEESDIYSELPDAAQEEYIRKVVKGVDAHSYELDSYIEKYAVGWTFSRISLIATAIMRVAMYEILYMPEIPARVAINEAINIAKKYETPETAKFMNGILGSFVRQEGEALGIDY